MTTDRSCRSTRRRTGNSRSGDSRAKPKRSICLLVKQADTAFWLCRAVQWKTIMPPAESAAEENVSTATLPPPHPQRQKAVTSNLKCKQLLLFTFAEEKPRPLSPGGVPCYKRDPPFPPVFRTTGALVDKLNSRTQKREKDQEGSNKKKQLCCWIVWKARILQLKQPRKK